MTDAPEAAVLGSSLADVRATWLGGREVYRDLDMGELSRYP